MAMDCDSDMAAFGLVGATLRDSCCETCSDGEDDGDYGGEGYGAGGEGSGYSSAPAPCPSELDFLSLPALIECGITDAATSLASAVGDPSLIFGGICAAGTTPQPSCPQALSTLAQEMAACACAEGTAICPIVQGVVLGAFAGSTCDTIRASLVAATCDDCGLDKCDEGGDGGDGDDSDGTFEFRSPSVVNDAWSLHDFTPDIMQWCLLYFCC